MINEIGGEFWHTEQSKYYNFEICDNQLLMLSGRTALDFIIRDIKAEKLLRTVYLPSYCCHAMIEPFKKNNIEIYFYNVSVKESGGFQFDIDYDFECDAIYLIQYFGFQDNQIDIIAKKFKDRGIIIIEDITHSIFTVNPYSKYADYVFGSLRKWTSLYTGGIAAKTHGKFLIRAPSKTNKEYYHLRKRAAELKSDYIKKGIGNKQDFLNLFNKAEMNLIDEYSNYLVDNSSLNNLKHVDISYIKNKRRINSEMILKVIKNIDFIKPIYKEVTYHDTPLFVPVIINNNLRDEFKKHLAQNRIYCPVHWIMTEDHDISKPAEYIYKNIISLVCDQRYSENEMLYFIEIINKIKSDFNVYEGINQ